MAELQITKKYNIYISCAAYVACCFGGEFFILENESEEHEDATQ